MRSFVLVIMIALAAGCGDDAADSSPPDAAVCGRTQCTSACAPGTTCVSGKTFDATCLKPCDTNDDCSGGDFCVILEPGSSPSGNYCANPGHPAHCAQCMSGTAIYCNGDVLMGPSETTCGIMRQRCPSVCGDGGTHGASCP
jgi:hypothetical protein